MTDFNLVLKNIEILVATVSTLIALLFITVDVWRSLSSIVAVFRLAFDLSSNTNSETLGVVFCEGYAIA
jgi:hypothetical protein